MVDKNGETWGRGVNLGLLILLAMPFWIVLIVFVVMMVLGHGAS